MQQQLLHASEISLNYNQKLLVMTDNDESTEEQVNSEYSLDPHNSEIVSVECLQKSSCVPEADGNTVVKIFGRLSADGQTVSGLSGSSLAEKMLDLVRNGVPLISLVGSTSTEFQHSFLQTLLSHDIRAVLEMNQIYKAISEPDPVSRYEIPQEEVDHTTQYDHQHILMMENDPVVVKAAEYLWQKHSAISSVYVLDENQQPKLLYGDPVPLTENSRLVVVGHGSRENSGEMTLSGYEAKDVADIIKRTNRVGDKIKTVSFVACELGSEPAFAETVLTELDAANIKTELHLRQGKVQVTDDGKKITQATNEAEWRHKDGTQKVVAVLDNNRKAVITKKSKSKGEVVSISQSYELIDQKPTSESSKENSPEQPQIFLDQNVMMDVGWEICMDLMAWSSAFFDQDLPPPRKVDISNVRTLKNKYRIMKFTKNNQNVEWLETEPEVRDVLSNCYEIKSGADVRNIIHHYAQTREKKITYLMVNDLIYAVDKQSLYVYLIGKKLDNNEIDNTEKIKEIEESIKEQIGNEKYPNMRQHIVNKSTKYSEELSMESYVKLVKDIFRGERTTHLPFSTEAWCTTYFTASIISESARNYRTFLLIVTALAMTDSTDNNYREIGLKLFFENHPMARGESWVDPSKRGHRGTARAEGSSKLENKRNKARRTIAQLIKALKRVVELEVKQYKSWKKNRDPQEVRDQMLRILVEYNVIQQSEREMIVKRYNFYHEHINSTPASGPLGRYDDSLTTTQDLMSASELDKLENDLLLESHSSRLKASVVDQVHSQLKIQYRDNLVQMHLQEGSARIEDGEFICQLVSKGVGPVEFRVKLSPQSMFYNEEMSTVHELETDSYIGNILWSVVKSSAFVLLVIVTIRTTERDSDLRNRRRSRDGSANRTAGVHPKKKSKAQKITKLISIVVDTQEGPVWIQIELFTPLSHYMNTYCEEQNGTIGSFRFYYKNCSINVTDTPSQLGMEDGDIIEMYLRPTSG